MSAPATIHPAALHGAAIYRTAIAHVRRTPLRNAFTYRSYSWYVDVDHLPQLPRLLRPLAGFRVEDHLGDPDGTLRGNVESYLATQGIKLDGGRITMLASARVFGHVFNPLSVFWCHSASGELRCVVAEVHNTYGERHCYLLETDATDRASVPKAFLRLPVQRRRRRVPHEAPRTRRTARRIDRPGTGGTAALHRHHGRRPARSKRAEHRVRGARRTRGPAACRGADPLAGHQTVGAPPAHHQKTTPPFTGGSSVTMTEATGSGTGRAQGTTHSSAVAGSAVNSGLVTGRVPYTVPAASRHHRRRHLAQHRHGALEPQGPCGRTRCGRHLQGGRAQAAAGSPVPGRHSIGQRALGTAPPGTRRHARGAAAYPVMTINRPVAFATRLGDGGLIGLGESFMAGDWDADDLTAVMEVLPPASARSFPSRCRSCAPCTCRASRAGNATRRRTPAPTSPGTTTSPTSSSPRSWTAP